jgi:hypothetical protein
MASIQTLDGNFRGRRKENLNNEFQCQNHPKEDVATSSSQIFARTNTHRGGGGISPDKYQKVPWCSCPQSNLWWKNNISSLSEGFQFHQECKAPVDLRKQRQFSNHC